MILVKSICGNYEQMSLWYFHCSNISLKHYLAFLFQNDSLLIF